MWTKRLIQVTCFVLMACGYLWLNTTVQSATPQYQLPSWKPWYLEDPAASASPLLPTNGWNVMAYSTQIDTASAGTALTFNASDSIWTQVVTADAKYDLWAYNAVSGLTVRLIRNWHIQGGGVSGTAFDPDTTYVIAQITSEILKMETVTNGPGIWEHTNGNATAEHTNQSGWYDHTGGTNENLFTKTAGDNFAQADADNGNWIMFTDATNQNATAEIKEYISTTQVIVDGLGWGGDIATSVSSAAFSIFKHPSFVSGDGFKNEFSVDADGEFEVKGYSFVGNKMVEFESDIAASGSDAVHIVHNANGYGESDALSIFFNTGLMESNDENSAIHVMLDESAASDGEVDVINLETTNAGAITKHAIHVGVGFDQALHVSSAVAADPDYGWEIAAGVVIDRVNSASGGTAAFISTVVNEEIFSANGDYILIGSDATFEVIAYVAETGSNRDLAPAFYYSTAGGGWPVLTAAQDGTQGFQQSGNIRFAAPVGWSKDDEAEANGDITNAYYIKIERTRVGNPAIDAVENHFKTFLTQSGGMNIRGDGVVQFPYLVADPGTLINGLMWYEADGVHAVFNGAENILAVPGAFDATAQDDLTWSDGANAANTWTFDVSGVDHTMIFGNNVTTFSGDVIVGGSDLTLNATGVQLTGSADGDITLLGLGDGFDEDLNLNLDDTENTVVVTSTTGVTEFYLSVMGISAPRITFPDVNASSTTVGVLLYDNTVSGFRDGALGWYDDDAMRYMVDLATRPSNDDYVVAYDSAIEGFYMKADAGAGQDFADVLGVDPDGADIDQTSLGKLEFFDAGLFIDADADGVMLISSDGTLELASGDWAISTTGVQTNMGAITSDGTITGAALDASDGNITNVGTLDVDLVQADGAALVLGDAGATTAITSSDWAISTTGVQTNMGAITSNGTITGAALDASDGNITNVGSILADIFAGDAGSATIGSGTEVLTMLGTLDAGGATSLEIPNGANPTTNAEGEIAWDSNDDALEVYMGDESESALIPAYFAKDATIFAPDGVNDNIYMFRVDALLYPFGIEIDQVSMTLNADAAYTLSLAEWTGDPPTSVSTIQVMTTGAGDAYVEYGSPTDGTIAADNYVYMHIYATDIDWAAVQVIFHVTEGN